MLAPPIATPEIDGVVELVMLSEFDEPKSDAVSKSKEYGAVST